MEEQLKDRKGFSRSSLSKLGANTEEAAPELVAWVWALETLPGAEQAFELYRRGLASMEIEVPAEMYALLGSTPPPRVDPEEITKTLVPSAASST